MPHRAAAAFLAMLLRSSWERAAARALPPLAFPVTSSSSSFMQAPSFSRYACTLELAKQACDAIWMLARGGLCYGCSRFGGPILMIKKVTLFMPDGGKREFVAPE